MSMRKRHHGKQTEEVQIEWLKHRTGYPSPDEREKIISMRQELSAEILSVMISKDKTRLQSLTRKYGMAEVERATNAFNATIDQITTFIADDARSFREYRHRYGRFGAGLKFYTSKEINGVYAANLKSMEETDSLDGVTELNKLLLFDWRDWEDITPPNIPRDRMASLRQLLLHILRLLMNCWNGATT